MKKVITRANNWKKSLSDAKRPQFSRLKNKKDKVLYVLAVLSGFGLLINIVAAIGIIFVFTAFSSTLPSPSRLTNRSIEESTKIYDRNSELLYSVFDEKDRTLVSIENISPYLIAATLSAEDSDFYFHQGIDPIGIARSVYVNLTTSGKQGGSTLTQQVAKNALLSSDRTITRKIKDVVLALQIEQTYSKDEILQMYLNEIPYGGTTYGIESAAKTFFDKKASDLTLAESALLAGLPQRPTFYSPFTNPEAAKNRQRYVLTLMRDKGWVNKEGLRQTITSEEFESAVNEELNYAVFQGTLRAPHFVMYVLHDLRERYGEDLVDKGGLIVTTTLDVNLYNEYQQILREEIEKARGLDLSNGALVAFDTKTREILAMVGSKNYFANDIDGQYNVTIANRQPGSTLKPLIYLAGMLQGYTASSVMYDVPTKFDSGAGPKTYEPSNYGGWGFRGPIQIRYALANSVNVTAVKMLDLVGIPNMVRLANELGVKSLKYDPSKHGLAIALGGGEVTLLDLTNGFATLGAGGIYKNPTFIIKVTDSSGKVLEENKIIEGKRIIDARQAWIISDILSDNGARTAAFGSNSQLNIPSHKVAVKTGTSNDFKDNWTVGYTSDIAIGVWVGNNDGKVMNSRLASGLTGAAPIWNRAIRSYLQNHPHPEFTRPEGIVESWVGTLSGMVQYDRQEDRRIEYFIEGTEPKTRSEIFLRAKICKKGEIRDKEYITYIAEKPEWQIYLDGWVKNRYKDNEDELFTYMGPDFEKEYRPDRFDLENCEDDDD